MTNHYAIKFTGKRQYMIIGFHSQGERDTFIKYVHSGFQAIKPKQIDKYLGHDVMRLCNCYIKTVFDHNGKRIAKVGSLYKPLAEQKIDRPEDSVTLVLPKTKSKTVVDGTTAHNYRMTL